PGRPSGDDKEQEPAENEGAAGAGLSPPGDRADIAARRHHIRPRHARSRNRTAFVLGCPAVLAEERPASQARLSASTIALFPSAPRGERSFNDYSAPTAVTSISSSMPGMVSALMTRNVLAGIGPSP